MEKEVSGMPPAKYELRVFDDAAALADACAAWLYERAVASQGRCAIALSGGSTPAPTYARLARAPLAQHFPWSRVHWFWGDERFVAHEHPDSNYRLARDAFLAQAPVPRENLHPVPTAGLTPEAAAARYESELKRWYGAERLSAERPLFEVNLLGIGDDGHTASLIPGQPVLEERERWVVAVSRGRPEPRITLTYPALESSRVVAFLISGAKKREVLRRVLAGDATLPAARLRPRGAGLIFADRAACPG